MTTAFALGSHGTTLFDGSLNYDAGGNTPFAGGFTPAATTQTVTAAYNLATPMIAGATYGDLTAGPDLFGGVYGFAESTVANTGVPSGVYRGGDTPEKIRFQSPMSTSSDVSLTLNAALLLDATAAGADFSAITGLAADMALALAPTTGGYTLRWMVVGDSGTTYVSQSTVSGLTAIIATYTLANPAAETWAAVTPDGQMSIGTPTFNVAGSSIGSITHVGLYLAASATGVNSRFTMDISNYSATSQAVVAPAGVVIGIVGDDVTLTFDSVDGQGYQLLRSDGGLDNFLPVSGASDTGNGGPLTLTDIGGKPASGGKVFYQVEVN